jgi:hypothetical protein
MINDQTLHSVPPAVRIEQDQIPITFTNPPEHSCLLIGNPLSKC